MAKPSDLGPRTLRLTRQVFLAQLNAGLVDEAFPPHRTLLDSHWASGDWEYYCIEAQWLAGQYLRADRLGHARDVLLAGLRVAREHGLFEQQRQISLELETLTME